MNKELVEHKLSTIYEDITNLVVELKGYSLPSRVEYEHIAYYDTGLGHFYWKKEYPEGAPAGFEPVFRIKANAT